MLSAERTPTYLPFSRPLHAVPNSRIRLIPGMTTTQSDDYEHIWIIGGPAGCGKTTVAQFLAKELSLPYVEGDDVCILE